MNNKPKSGTVSVSRELLEELRNVCGAPSLWQQATEALVQPATAKVVLPERKPESYSTSVGLIPYHEGWNACLDEVAKLNGVQS